MKRNTSIFILSLLFVLLCTVNVHASTKSYYAKPWATNYSFKDIVWCPKCGYDECSLKNYVDVYRCPKCKNYNLKNQGDMQFITFQGIKCSEDYIVTIKKNQKCLIRFPISKSSRKTRLGKGFYGWSPVISNIKHLGFITGKGQVLKYGSDTLLIKCSKESRCILAFGKKVVVLRIRLK